MQRLPITVLILIILIGAFLRFYLINEFPLGLYPDEAMNGNNALEALATGDFKIFYPENNGREGLFINLQAISLWLFGNEPWALRLVSAIFGALTILGIYLLTKELFCSLNSKSEILNPKQIPNPNDQNTKPQTRVSSFGFRNLNLFGNWNLEIGNYRADIIALLSSFFLATSYWHINFSRIGFRAIMVPFFATFGIYFLLKGLRKTSFLNLVLAGIFIGLGFHTYIAFRFMPLVLSVPILWHLWQWRKERTSKISGSPTSLGSRTSKNCAPCTITLFLFVTLIVILPIGWYFLQNPHDFLGRSGQVSIFSAETPLKEFLKSTGLTLQMFFWKGDCNWRHNLACKPELHPIVATFFALGTVVALFGLLKSQIPNPKSQTNPNDQNSNYQKRIWNLKIWKLFGNWSLEFGTSRNAAWMLTVWFVVMILPATLTREGLPHALRSIGMIPPVMILSGLGAYTILRKFIGWTERKTAKWPEFDAQIQRIKREGLAVFFSVLILLPLQTYIDYFLIWAQRPQTFYAFSTDLWHLGQFLNEKPYDTKKYVIVNLPGVEVRGLSMPAQTVMFATNTFSEKHRAEKNIKYILPQKLDAIDAATDEKVIITLLKGDDRELIKKLKNRFGQLKLHAPGDFMILENK